jgi:hypothetical protein
VLAEAEVSKPLISQLSTTTILKIHLLKILPLLSRSYNRKNLKRSPIEILSAFIFSALGGLVVSVLATGPKVRGFDPDRGPWIFKGDKKK